MGIDLTLLPYHPRHGSAEDVLSLNRSSGLFLDLRAAMDNGTVRAEPVPDDFDSYVSRERGRDSHYGLTVRDSYGERLMAVPVSDLRPFADHRGVQEFDNRPAWAYLEALPDDWMVALYWC